MWTMRYKTSHPFLPWADDLRCGGSILASLKSVVQCSKHCWGFAVGLDLSLSHLVSPDTEPFLILHCRMELVEKCQFLLQSVRERFCFHQNICVHILPMENYLPDECCPNFYNICVSFWFIFFPMIKKKEKKKLIGWKEEIKIEQLTHC